MDWINITDALSRAEPLLWIAVLVSAYVGEMRSRDGSARNARPFNETPPHYFALKAFCFFKFLASLAYPVFADGLFPVSMSPQDAKLAYSLSYWCSYLLASISVFFVMAALLRRSLQPLPGLSTAALALFRWAALLALLLALTAHLPIFGVTNYKLLLNETSISFVLCICAFELSLLSLLLGNIRRLGMCLRSRPIGFAFGLVMLSIMDLSNAATINMSQHVQNIVATWSEITNVSVTLLWIFYILRPEPKRLPHGLSPASRLMKWNEIALKLGVSGKQAESVPFISGVESTVDAILERFKGRVG